MPFIDTPETNALKSKVEKLLSEIPDFTDENKNLKINVIKDYADNGNVKLLEPLLKNPQTKKAFFTPVLDSSVFNTAKFKEFLEYSSACNSYSKYLGKKIGLYMGDSSLLDRNEVVLNFPFKDCVLEGGQRKEDGLDTYYEYDDKKGEYEKKQSKRREVFYNEVLAQDEIDSLFSPKAFCNAKRYEKGKSEKCTKLNRDAELNKKRGLSEDTITDNLIIKGNNLLALHSLKKEFAGKVKLIYIDVPFNTGNDEFKYNDNFNHSSWLTFMKNRLEVARVLLQKQGIIFLQIGNEECSYIQVLLDSIFGRSNYLNHITMTTNAPSGFKATSGKIFSTSNHIFVYKNSEEAIEMNKQYVPKSFDNAYKYILKNPDDNPENWKYENFYDNFAQQNNYKNFKEMKKQVSEEELEIKLLKFMDTNKKVVFRTAAISGGALEKRKQTIEKSKMNRNKVFIHPNEDIDDFYILNGEMIVFWENTYKLIDNKMIPAMALTDVWNDIGFTGIANEGDVTLKNGKKPEKLLKRIVDLATKESDIVLDYHLGSGTTAAVAHKMNRQYIGIEQLDYGENDSVVRLQNVINGDQSGISKSVNWQGGGSFVYLELAKKNETALEQISACKSLEELTELFDELCSKYFLHYNVRVKEFRKEIESERFKQLNLKQQKEMFSRMLDLNQLYVNTDDRHDKNTGLTEDDIAITEDFYQLAKDGE